jgi:uncharacterized protein YdhG (YjbR/CyaY superfamily)
MELNKTDPSDIDGYIANCPKDVRPILNKLRQKILDAAPDAEEKISYHMPTFLIDGSKVYFALWKNHIGFYGATPTAMKELKEEVAPYLGEKGTLKFPIDEPLPLDLVGRIVKLRVKESRRTQKK